MHAMITVLGSINMDLIAKVDGCPKPGETVRGLAFATSAGGKGANQALAARRAGADVLLFGAVGRDRFAEPALALLKSEGVDLESIRTVDEATGIALIQVDSTGENEITVVSGANWCIDRIDAAYAVQQMKTGDHLLMQMEIPADALEVALTNARKAGVTSLLNIAPFTADAAGLAGLADVVIANENEFGQLCGKTGMIIEKIESELKSMHDETGQTVIVTLGGDGVIAARHGQISRIAAMEVDTVDTVGAGDTFCGYFAAGLDGGMDIDAALQRAAIAASLACMNEGAQPAIPTARDTDAALEIFVK
jgi:ribokinase